jgi:diguanylate cyclase (GGDEF)-like protein
VTSSLCGFQPRNPSLARTVLFILTVVASVTTLAVALTSSVGPAKADLPLQITVCATLLGSVTALRLRPTPLLWAIYPFLAVAGIAVLDLATRDASLPAQVFLFFPVLYAGAQLRGGAAIAICVGAIVGDAVVVFSIMPMDKAVVDAAFAGAAFAATCALLLVVGHRVDSLIEQLEHQAAVDPLTGLLTRRVLDQAALAAVDSTASDLGTALLVMDVDRFKAVNDGYGHPAGDAVLKQLADILVRASRRDDVISRMGGDEIAVLLPGCTLAAAVERAESIVRTVRAQEFVVADGLPPVPVSVSVGVAHLPTHAPDQRSLYLAADAALYDAKHRGRDRMAVAGGGASSLLAS